MQYFPERLIIKRGSNGIVEIKSDNELIARIELKHDVWRLSSKEKSDEQYMQAIELLGNTQKIEGIGAHYQIGGVIVPVFQSRETTDGIKIFYDTSCNSDLSVSFRENKRDCADKIITPRYWSYEHMKDLNITDLTVMMFLIKRIIKQLNMIKPGLL